MSVLTIASHNSKERGYDYYVRNQVREILKSNETEAYAVVNGSGLNLYAVYVNFDYPRKSTCNCPHANGKRIACKHQVAVYLKTHPEEVQEFYERYVHYDEDDYFDEEEYELAHEYLFDDEFIDTLDESCFDGFEFFNEMSMVEIMDFVDGMSEESVRMILAGILMNKFGNQ